MAERGFLLTPSEELVEQVARQGYDPQYGARPIKRMIKRNCSTRAEPLDH